MLLSTPLLYHRYSHAVMLLGAHRLENGGIHFPTRSQHFIESLHASYFFVGAAFIEHLPFPNDIIENKERARMGQAQRQLKILRIGRLVGIDKNKIKGRFTL